MLPRYSPYVRKSPALVVLRRAECTCSESVFLTHLGQVVIFNKFRERSLAYLSARVGGKLESLTRD